MTTGRHSNRRRSNRARNARANPSLDDGLIVAGAALGAAGLVFWYWGSRGADSSTLPTAPSPPRTEPIPTQAPPSSGSRSAVLSERSHLRPSASTAPVGPVLAPGTRVVLLERTTTRRGQATLWRVRVPDGRIGFAFVLPEEIR